MLYPNTETFMGLEAIEEGRWRLPVTDRVIGGGRGSLFGGIGAAAGVVLLERVSGKPAVWATAQYASTVHEGGAVEFDVELVTVGKSVTQGRVTGRSDGREILSIVGATGERPEKRAGTFETAPSAPPPDQCQLLERKMDGTSVHDQTETRMARGMFGFTGFGEPSGDHRTLMWVRLPEVGLDQAGIAIIADYGPSVLGNAFSEQLSCTSLDNTVRYAERIDDPADGWVLLDNRLVFAANGFAMSSSLVWSADGRLLAEASQSMVVYPLPSATG